MCCPAVAFRPQTLSSSFSSRRLRSRAEVFSVGMCIGGDVLRHGLALLVHCGGIARLWSGEIFM